MSSESGALVIVRATCACYGAVAFARLSYIYAHVGEDIYSPDLEPLDTDGPGIYVYGTMIALEFLVVWLMPNSAILVIAYLDRRKAEEDRKWAVSIRAWYWPTVATLGLVLAKVLRLF